MTKQTRKQQGGQKQKQQQGGQKQQQGGQKQQQGGKRHKRAATRKGTPWTQLVTKTYREMKKKDPSVKLGDAMKEASRRKKRGDL